MGRHMDEDRQTLDGFAAIERDIGSLYGTPVERFDELVSAANLLPAHDFTNRDLCDLDLSGADLRGFDFAGSDLTGANLRKVARIDASTNLIGTKLDAEDAAWNFSRVAQQLDAALVSDRASFRRARDSGELFIVYQPKLSLRSNEVRGLEVIVRWRHPSLGLIGSEIFVPAAEESGEIDRLTLWTIEKVIQDQRTLARAGHDLPVAVDLSPKLMGNAHFFRECADLVRGAKGRLDFDFPEIGVILDMDTSVANLSQLVEAGARLAVDDYGAGLSSLTYLKRMPAVELKIDRSFIVGITASNRDPLLVRSTIDLAHALDMEVTAMGVETSATLALLTVMGCDMVQGYLVGRPTDIEGTVAALNSRSYQPALSGDSWSFMRKGATAAVDRQREP